MIKVLLADDHNIVRAGVKELLSDTDDIVVAGEAGNGHEVLARVREQEFDVAVLDMSMPGRSGIELIRQVKSERPKLKVLVLSMHSEQQYAVRALQAGASGYLTKESAADQLVAAIRRVAAGGAYVSAETAEQLALGVNPANDKLPHTRLSNREYEVFRMLAAGKSVTAIADALAVSVKTVSTHKTRIMQKMQLANPTELIRYALEHGLVDDARGEA
ncbi:MAG: response regulator transcription factor [Betaproteobacteria bacterium]|nr:response regulator transcription factor [Betaproteobacteria bacterium]